MKIVAFIPARSGSSRLKNKNIKLLKKRPLIYWSFRSAIKSNVFDQIIFSSDSSKYYRILVKYLIKDQLIKSEKEITFDHRIKKHSNKKAKIFDYVKSDLVKKFDLKKDSLLVQMLPTAPFRSVKTIKKAISKSLVMKKNIFSASEYDFHVSFSFEILNKKWKNLFKSSPMKSGKTQSQDQKTIYHPNGVINCLWVKNLVKKPKTIYDNAIPIITTKIEAYDIDTEIDFNICESIAQSDKNKKDE